MSDSNSEGENFPDFQAREDPEEGGLTTNEMIMGLGFMLIVVGFILGLIRLMGLKGGEIPSDYNNHLEQLYLAYVIMFVGMVITCVIGFGSMFKKALESIGSKEQ